MDFSDQVKASVDIVSVVGEHVRLRKSGPYRHMGLCPFHNEKSPSFTVHATYQFYKCFSCGAYGDVFKFVMEIEGISFYEALKALAERHGIPMPKRSTYADEDARQRGALLAMHEAAQENFRANLDSPAGEAARSYLERRGVSRATIDQFGLGYSDRSGSTVLKLLRQRDFPTAQLEGCGLVRKRDDGSFYDYFRNRLMFPIHNEQGKIIGFGGRALAADDNPKYLNSPETAIYKKSYVLYNLHRAKDPIRKEDRAILVEGYMDAIGVTAAGVGAVVASCGTSLTSQQVQALKRSSQRIVVNFDPDAPGANAAEKSISLLLDEGMQVRIMELDGDLDPDEYCKERGADAYRERLDGAKGYFYWLADRARAKFDLRTTEGQVAVLKSLMPAVHRISDRMERMVIAGDVASYLGVDRGMVLDSFKKAVADRQEKSFERPKIVLRHDERMLLQALLGNAEVRAEVIDALKSLETIATFPSRRIFQAMFALDANAGRFNFEELHARLEEGDQNLLAHAVLNDDQEVSSEEVMAAVDSIRRTEDQHRRALLKGRIKEAERAGNWQEALRLAAELQGLEQGSRSQNQRGQK
jgi:DNA primase